MICLHLWCLWKYWPDDEMKIGPNAHVMPVLMTHLLALLLVGLQQFQATPSNVLPKLDLEADLDGFLYLLPPTWGVHDNGVIGYGRLIKKMKLLWVDRFIISAIIQGAVITIMALVIVAIQATNSEINIIQYLSLSFEGTAKWFFFGIIFHLIVIVAVAVTALFYSHLQITLKKRVLKDIKCTCCNSSCWDECWWRRLYDDYDLCGTGRHWNSFCLH